MPRKFEPSPLALAILALLHESPMHPYKMQRLIKERGKDQVIKVDQRKSLYQTIEQLQRAGLIESGETERQEGLPERTLYKLTDEGRHTAAVWLREMLSTPAGEFPVFPAAISLIPLLTSDDALRQLEIRASRLTAQIAALDTELHTDDLPRLFLLESEYLRAVLDAELKWVQSILSDLQSGHLTWNHDWMDK